MRILRTAESLIKFTFTITTRCKIYFKVQLWSRDETSDKARTFQRTRRITFSIQEREMLSRDQWLPLTDDLKDLNLYY